jgi:hexokinase
MDDYLREVARLFTTSLSHATMLEMSSRLQYEFKPKLQEGTANMLPSFNHTMPTGDETGTFLSLDVGGSNLRVAIVTLSGRTSDRPEPMKIAALQSWRIDDEIKSRKGKTFFDWIAWRIDNMLSAYMPELGRDPTHPLEIGLAWSFPIA